MKIDDSLSKILIVLLTLISTTLLSCTPTTESEPADIQAAPMTDNEAETTGGPPPLVVDTSAPLLLDEPTEEEEAFAVAATQAAAENTACFVCHANYMTEFLANRHANPRPCTLPRKSTLSVKTAMKLMISRPKKSSLTGRKRSGTRPIPLVEAAMRMMISRPKRSLLAGRSGASTKPILMKSSARIATATTE
jgi:hypothetical protein